MNQKGFFVFFVASMTYRGAAGEEERERKHALFSDFLFDFA